MREGPRRPRVTVRDKVGRTRYVAFRIVEGGPLSRPALSGALPSIAKLTRFDGVYGVLRTNHRDRDALLAVLKAPLIIQAKEVRLETLTTSGTLRRAATALPAESEASKRAPQRG